MKITELYNLRQSAVAATAVQKSWDLQKLKLLQLPAKLGFESLADLRKAIDLVSTEPHAHAGLAIKSRKRRTTITKRLKTRVKTMVQSGATNAQIAASLHVATSTVQNIKSALHLTKRRQ